MDDNFYGKYFQWDYFASDDCIIFMELLQFH